MSSILYMPPASPTWFQGSPGHGHLLLDLYHAKFSKYLVMSLNATGNCHAYSHGRW